MTLMIWCEREVRTWKEVAFEPPSVVIAQNSTSSESSWSSCGPFDTAPLCTWTAFFCLGAHKKGKQGPWRQQILHPQPWQSIASSYKTTWPETSSTFSTFHLILATWWTWTWSGPRWSQTGQASTPLDSLQIDGLVMFGGLNRKRKAKVEVLCWHFLLHLMSKWFRFQLFQQRRVPSEYQVLPSE